MNPNVTQSPADRAMDLLRELGGRIGVATEKLWPKAVRYVAMDAAGVMIGWLFAALTVTFIGWRLRQHAEKNWGGGAGDGLVALVTVLSWLATVGLWIGVGVNFAMRFARIVEPTGALVFDALAKVAR